MPFPTFQDLQKLDPSLELIFQKRKHDDLEILGLGDFFAPAEGQMIFIQNQKYLRRARECQTRDLGFVLSHKFFDKLEDSEVKALEKQSRFLGRVQDIGLAISRFSHPYYLRQSKSWNDEVDGRQLGTADIHPTVYISQNVFIGKGVKIGADSRIHPGAVIRSYSEIGKNCEIFPNVSLYPHVKVGNQVRIHAGAVVGGDGFGHNWDGEEHLKVWHTGGVVIQDDVEIGCNSCIDQGTFSPTFIGQGTKIDNHVQIGHNCQIGRGVIFCGHVAIGGSTIVGDFTVFGGNSVAGDNLVIGKRCLIAGSAAVAHNWPDNSQLGGYPARELWEWKKSLVYLKKMSLERNK